MHEYKLGIEGLDQVIGESIYPGTLLVIAGHPGTGKTTLSSTICYSNALRRYKCLLSPSKRPRKSFSGL
ncbi:MAG: ATPase domain-containing protein [Desulfurococcaceae archaeon]